MAMLRTKNDMTVAFAGDRSFVANMQSLKVGVTRVINVRDVVPSLPGFTATALKQASSDAKWQD